MRSKKHLAEMMCSKIIEVRDVSIDEAVKLIDYYISKHPGKHYVSELAEELGIELSVAFKASQKLIDSGEAEKREIE
jgi:DNA-binding MarR family transcriptional regulator